MMQSFYLELKLSIFKLEEYNSRKINNFVEAPQYKRYY